jgi:ligand-binding sensor domain-containing protein
MRGSRRHPGMSPSTFHSAHRDGSSEISRRIRVRCWFVWMFLSCLLTCFRASALDPNQPLAQLHHTTWTTKDGLNGSVVALAQTVDGYLWVGTTDGLFRFDGISFERYKPEHNQLPSSAVSTLLALPDGSLWIGYDRGGATHLKDGRATNYSDAEGFPVSTVRRFIQDGDGTIWAAVVGGFVRLEGGRWQTVGEEWNYPAKSAWTMLVDRKGTLWVATGGRIVFLPRGEKRFRDLGLQTGPVFAFNQLPDGSFIFYDDGDNRETVRAFRSPMDHRTDPLPDIRIPARQILLDRDGAMWFVGNGLSRISFPSRLSGRPILATTPGVERLTEDHGLTDNMTETLLEDREGNIWVGTHSGLERFRRRNLSW